MKYYPYTNVALQGAAGPTDPSFSSTVLLLKYEGADASTTFTDLSSKARGVGSVLGNAQVDTADFKFGTASGLFDGTGDGIFWGNSVDFQFGAGNFTIETWVKPSSVAAGLAAIVSRWDENGSTNDMSWVLQRTGAVLELRGSVDGTTSILLASGGTLVTTGWQHVCADYNGTKYRLYLDGVMVGSSTTPRTLSAGAQVLTIGKTTNPTPAGWAGWIDETRITKGVARYASDGGFSVPTATYPTS